MSRTTGVLCLLATMGLALVISLAPVDRAAAHPLDRLTQHLLIGLGSEQISLTLAIGGGVLANEVVLADLDLDRDGTATPGEIAGWRERVLAQIAVSLDGQAVAPSQATVTVPDLPSFHAGAQPILLSFVIPTGHASAERRLAIRNDYRLDRTDFLFAVETGSGTEVIDRGWPGSVIRVVFTADPAQVAAGDAGAVAAGWAPGQVISKAQRAFSHDRTPAFVLLMLGVFVVMGGLHALQPGHGKTLVAAYLVATGGTAWDALFLAAVVTLTHTVSVFALGGATLLASEIFLPSRVVPVMEVVSGLLVAAMGGTMLWRHARRRWQRRAAGTVLHHENDHDQHPHHHHESMTDEEHARLHLAEALAVRKGASRRSLASLGVAGGLVPCPDALAIMLLAIGLQQAAFGIVAIVAFSLGLAGVLVAFGLAVALAGPFWNRVRQRSATPGLTGWASIGFGRLASMSPLVSAGVVLVFGVGMILRAASGF